MKSPLLLLATLFILLLSSLQLSLSTPLPTVSTIQPLEDPAQHLTYLSDVSDSFFRRSSLIFAIHSLTFRCHADACPRCWNFSYGPAAGAEYVPRAVHIVAHNFVGVQAGTSDFTPAVTDWEFELELKEASQYSMGIQINARMGPEYPLDADYQSTFELRAVDCGKSHQGDQDVPIESAHISQQTDFFNSDVELDEATMTILSEIDLYTTEVTRYDDDGKPYLDKNIAARKTRKTRHSTDSFIPDQQLTSSTPQPLNGNLQTPLQSRDIDGYKVSASLLSPSLDSAKRAEVHTYFYNTYIPDIDPRADSPPGFDPHRAHAELQISAWYNFELLPRPANDELPNTLELHLHGRNYFVLDETYAKESGQTLCWINSLPAVVTIEPTLNQTIYLELQPRFDAHNPESVLNQPIPVSSANSHPLQARFFFEFTCQDRVKIVYDHTDTQLYEFLSILPSRRFGGKLETKFVDRYITDLQPITGFTHGPTPNEVMGLAYYDTKRNLVICRTTIDFWDPSWIDQSEEIRLVAGVDGMTFYYDQPEEPAYSSVLLSILPDPLLYPDIDPKVGEKMLDPRLYVSNVTHTGAGGAFVTFFLQDGFRPYVNSIHAPSATVQINFMFSLRDVKVNYPEPSCTIIVQGMKKEDKTLSYSTSQYLNVTHVYYKQHPEEERQYFQSFEDRHSHTQDNNNNQRENTTTFDTMGFSHHTEHSQRPQLKQQDVAEEEQSFFSQFVQYLSPTAIPEPLDMSDSDMSPQSFKFPETTSNGIVVTSDPFPGISIQVKNPNHVDFQYVAVQSQPGITRLKITDNDFTNDGEQILVPCRITSDKGKNRINVQGGLSIYTREIYIGPFPLEYIRKHNEYDITCENVKLDTEPINSIWEYDSVELTSKRISYSITDLQHRFKLEPLHHFVVLYSIFDSQSTAPKSGLDLTTLLFSGVRVTDDVSEQSQVYLSEVARFAIDEPKKSYAWQIFGIVMGCVGGVALLIAILPIKRYCENKRDKRRRENVHVQETSMVSLPFEELTD